MTKKLILMAAVGVLSFAGAFVVAWLTRPSAPPPSDKPETPAAASAASEQSAPEAHAPQGVVAASGTADKGMTEQLLKTLIQDVRDKIREYDNRLQALTVREQRLQTAQNLLKKDIENLNNLRTELAATVAAIKSERDMLLKSRLEIDQAERANLTSIAATYDKMDAPSASKILTNMCVAAADSKTQSAGAARSYVTLDDAVKILFYMTERTKAKLLAELATSEPQLAAVLSQRLKQIAEKQ